MFVWHLLLHCHSKIESFESLKTLRSMLFHYKEQKLNKEIKKEEERNPNTSTKGHRLEMHCRSGWELGAEVRNTCSAQLNDRVLMRVPKMMHRRSRDVEHSGEQ